MKKDNDNIFSMLKNEDRRYGEKTGKSHVVVKDRNQKIKTFKNMKPSEIVQLSDELESKYEYE